MPPEQPESVLGKRKRASPPKPAHPYLAGNFAPIQKTVPLTPCSYSGTIPRELLGGEYVRNGSNPVTNEDLGRDAHWFDGDGMISGVHFTRDEKEGIVRPDFVNQSILTDLFLSATSTSALKKPILPSIATLVNPVSTLLSICLSIFRAILLVVLSRLPGSEKTIKKISVANTSIIYHDGRALATCESGPPMRVQLPGLETVGWYNGVKAEGEPITHREEATFGGNGLLSWMKEWTTAHPRVDPETNEMILFHSSFLPPFVHYSVIPATRTAKTANSLPSKRLVSQAVSGVSSAKMMHDFGVSANHTVIMDLPLSLDPLQLAKNKAPIMYDPSKPSRFGIFPRHEPSNVHWFQTSACCIFHTVNTWDVKNKKGKITAIDMLACRMTSASLVFSAGNIAAPEMTGITVVEPEPLRISSRPTLSHSYSYEQGPSLESPGFERNSFIDSSPPLSPTPTINHLSEDDQCRLYYYSFAMSSRSQNTITHQWALSAITFEFPSVAPSREMSSARYVYGCTTTCGSFNTALGKAAKIDALAKFDVKALISRGQSNPPPAVTGCVDERSVGEILAAQEFEDGHLKDKTIQIFRLPPNHYAQEPRFVPSSSYSDDDDENEDAGYLLTYVFDESQLLPNGEPPPTAFSELWIVDAKGMRDVLAKIKLPQRVPYGLHGSWFPEKAILEQREVSSVRRQKSVEQQDDEMTWMERMGRGLTEAVVRAIGG